MAKSDQPVNINTISRISQGTCFKGVMTSPSDVRLDGMYEGDIVCEGKVVIGDDARFKGNITCEDLDFWGKAEGEFFVKGTLSMHSSCEIKGNIHTRKLYVELGASFNGNCSMKEDEAVVTGASLGAEESETESARE
ncbi:MAG: polymer-forming cytoskeletal protein [Bacteroidales bacterium]|nr:polymer-forming cytoskeletal protein [Bacteroidales bacterium]